MILIIKTRKHNIGTGHLFYGVKILKDIRMSKTRKTVNRRIIASVSVMTLFLATQAQAKNEISEDTPVDTIIVYGEKKGKSLQETPSSVRVITAETIENEKLTSVYDVLQRTVNVTEAKNKRGFSIRGINAFSVSGGGSSYLASMYVDGAALPRRAIEQGPLNMWDIGQIEILRGPQSTLQGKNALAGAIVIRSTDPTYDPNAKAQISVGNHGLREYSIAAGTGIIDDQLAIRVAAQSLNFNGFVFNPTQDKNQDYEKDRSFRTKLLFEPKGLEGFKSVLTFYHDEFDIGESSTIIGTPDKFKNRLNLTDQPTYEKNNIDIITLELSQEINDHWNLSSVSSYNHNKYEYEWDSDFSEEPLGTLYDTQIDKSYNQEVRANFEYDNFSGVIGLYHSNQKTRDDYGGTTFISLEESGVRQVLQAPPFGLSDALVDGVFSLYAPVDPLPISYAAWSNAKIKTYALFADGAYKITNHLSILGGFRLDREEQDRDSKITPETEVLAALPNPTNYDPLTSQIISGINGTIANQIFSANQESIPAHKTFSAFLPKAGLSYEWSEDFIASFVVQQGYRSGGAGTNIARAENFDYGKETTWNYELSLRTKWLDDTLIINANAYYMLYNDQLVLTGQINDVGAAIRTNVADSYRLGLELDGEIKISDLFKWRLNAALSQNKINDFVENIINKQMESGQFLNANITFKEIQSLKKVLKSKLANIYHLRIEYPE